MLDNKTIRIHHVYAFEKDVPSPLPLLRATLHHHAKLEKVLLVFLPLGPLEPSSLHPMPIHQDLRSYQAVKRQRPALWAAPLRKAISATPSVRASLIEELLPEQAIIMMASPPGQGKSCVLLTMLAQASLGLPVFKHLPCAHPLRAFVICPERPATELYERLHKMEECGFPYGDCLGIDDGLVGLVDIANASSTKLVRAELDRFAAAQNPPGIDLICFEGMYGMSRKPLASEEAANDFARWNAELQYNYKCALWYSHHTRKGAKRDNGEDLPLVWFGSQMLMAQVTGAFIFERMKDQHNRCKMENQKDTVSGLAAELIFDYDAETFTVELSADLGLLSSLQRLKSYINASARTGSTFTYDGLETQTNLSHSSIQRRLVNWVAEGAIINTNKQGCKALYRALRPV